MEEGVKESVKGDITVGIEVLAVVFPVTREAKGGNRQVKQFSAPTLPVRRGRAGMSLRNPSPPTTLQSQEEDEEKVAVVEHTLTLPPTSESRVAGDTVREGGAVGSYANTLSVKLLGDEEGVAPHTPSLETLTVYNPGGIMCMEEGE